MRRIALPLSIALMVAPPALASSAPRPRRPPVSVDVPETLTGGTLAPLEWRETRDFALFGPVEEWEAFLSLDGGRSYPMRVTPHLDVDLHRFLWRVPEVASNDARLLLRFGDEKRETAVEVPKQLRIAIVGRTDLCTRRLPSECAGEPARPGEPGVVSWIEGTRRGAELRSVEHGGQVGSMESTLATGAQSDRAGVVPPIPRLSLPERAAHGRAAGLAEAPRVPRPRAAPSFLLLLDRIERLNV